MRYKDFFNETKLKIDKENKLVFLIHEPTGQIQLLPKFKTTHLNMKQMVTLYTGILYNKILNRKLND